MWMCNAGLEDREVQRPHSLRSCKKNEEDLSDLNPMGLRLCSHRLLIGFWNLSFCNSGGRWIASSMVWRESHLCGQEPRPGVLELMDEARSMVWSLIISNHFDLDNVFAVCSAVIWPGRCHHTSPLYEASFLWRLYRYLSRHVLCLLVLPPFMRRDESVRCFLPLGT